MIAIISVWRSRSTLFLRSPQELATHTFDAEASVLLESLGFITDATFYNRL